MAYTLADFLRLADSDLKKGVIDVFRRESMIMDLMSFDNVDNLSVQVMRTAALPSVAFRKIGGTWSESKGEVEPVQENVYQMGGYFDVDVILNKAKALVNQRALQADMFTTALAYSFNDYFVNGDPTSDPDGFTGLWYRLVNHLAAAQSIEAASGGLDVSSDATGLAANQATLIDKIHEANHAIEGHSADAIFVNSTLKLRLDSALRASGLMDTTQDNYGRTVTTFGAGGPKIYDTGVKADQSTLIQPNTENPNGAALTGDGDTSAYFVRFGEQFLMGFQLDGLDVNDIGQLENGVALRTVISWAVGLALVNPRSISRLYAVTAA